MSYDYFFQQIADKLPMAERAKAHATKSIEDARAALTRAQKRKDAQDKDAAKVQARLDALAAKEAKRVAPLQAKLQQIQSELEAATDAGDLDAVERLAAQAETIEADAQPHAGRVQQAMQQALVAAQARRDDAQQELEQARTVLQDAEASELGAIHDIAALQHLSAYLRLRTHGGDLVPRDFVADFCDADHAVATINDPRRTSAKTVGLLTRPAPF